MARLKEFYKDKVTKELEKVKRAAAREIGDFNDAEDHRAILTAIVGNGYEHDESGRRLLRNHAAAIVEQIEGKAKGDLLKQMQLAEAVKRRLSPANFEPEKDLYVALAITESIRAWMKELKSKYLIKHVKEHVNANLTTMYAQSDGCKAQFKNTTHYLWISEQYGKTGIRADWTFFCSCHGKCDCDPEGGACKNLVKLHQLRDSAQNRTIINNIDELAAFLEANFKNPTKSYFAKRGGGAIYQRHIHYVKASEIEVTRRDLVHAEYSLKKSDCYRQICDIGEPGVVVCRHRSCHQCRHDHKDEVGGDCIDLDFACCKEEAHCGAPQERALTAVQFEQDEEAMEFRALALQEQARRIQSGEIVCVANHDVETRSCLPFLIGKVCQTPLLAFGDSFFKSKR
jgi:hypothetical protein